MKLPLLPVVEQFVLLPTLAHAFEKSAQDERLSKLGHYGVGRRVHTTGVQRPPPLLNWLAERSAAEPSAPRPP